MGAWVGGEGRGSEGGRVGGKGRKGVSECGPMNGRGRKEAMRVG